MFGEGLIEGLKITVKNIFSPVVTEEYPEVKPCLPEGYRGNFSLDSEKCIACGVCVQACPNKRAIEVKSTRDENNKRKLESFQMDLGYCLFCGFCVEACPTKALNFTPEFELACYHRLDMVQDMLQRPAAVLKPTTQPVMERANKKNPSWQWAPNFVNCSLMND